MEKKLITLRLEDIIPYENNPRKNKKAIKTVKESIRQTGYNNPIVVDEKNIILCGHTRRLALMELGWKEADVLQVLGLSDWTKKKYRLLDNKVGEYATWDFVALTEELAKVDFGDLALDWGLDDGYGDGEPSKEKKKKKKTEYICPECGFHFEA